MKHLLIVVLLAVSAVPQVSPRFGPRPSFERPLIQLIHKHYLGSDAGDCIRAGHTPQECNPSPLFLSMGEVTYSFNDRFRGTVGPGATADIIYWNAKYIPKNGNTPICYVLYDKTTVSIVNGSRYDQYDVQIGQDYPTCPISQTTPEVR